MSDREGDLFGTVLTFERSGRVRYEAVSRQECPGIDDCFRTGTWSETDGILSAFLPLIQTDRMLEQDGTETVVNCACSGVTEYRGDVASLKHHRKDFTNQRMVLRRRDRGGGQAELRRVPAHQSDDLLVGTWVSSQVGVITFLSGGSIRVEGEDEVMRRNCRRLGLLDVVNECLSRALWVPSARGFRVTLPEPRDCQCYRVGLADARISGDTLDIVGLAPLRRLQPP